MRKILSEVAQASLLLWLAATAGDFLQTAAAQTALENRVYTVPRSELEETKKMLESVISSQGKVYVLRSQGKILVQDTEEGLRRVDELYRRIMAPAPNVRIEFFSNDVGIEAESGFRPGVVVQGNRIWVEAEVIDQLSTRGSRSSQFLLVRNGGTATLEIGRWVPVPEYFYRLCCGLGLIPVEVRYEFVGRALQVTPHIHGNWVDLEIMPVLSALVEGKPTTIELQTLKSRITVPNGGIFSLGGFDSADEEFNRHFFARGRGRQARTGSFSVRVSIEEPDVYSTPHRRP